MAIRQLSVPPEANQAGQACEILRGWLIDHRLVCSLLPGAFDDSRAWGILLADVAHHIANALAESDGADPSTVLEGIVKTFNVEMQHPTDEQTGGFIEPEGPTD